MSDIFLYGAGGHAKVVIDIIKESGKDSIRFLIDDAVNLKGTIFSGYPVVGTRHDLLDKLKKKPASRGIISIGENDVRYKIYQWFLKNGMQLATAIHPQACLAKSATLGYGTVLMAGVVINASVIVGNNSIINTHSSIDHDSNIGNHVHIGPGSVLCGNVTIGDLSMIGAGSTVVPNITIGKKVVVGAGSTVIHDVPDGIMVAGSPARVIQKQI
jgi:sugar O-acyltransferase (sialic acid O-acetyltransferase NeuD family)